MSDDFSQSSQVVFRSGYAAGQGREPIPFFMDNGNQNLDPAEFLASLERRHEDVLREIDRLAERIEKTLLDHRSTFSPVIKEKVTHNEHQV